MKAVVIGGHTRNIGKTSLMAALIREFAPLAWTAVKITQFGHGICSHDGHSCDCAPEEHPFALSEETDLRGRTDTCRYLAAGARRSYWLRVRQGQLASALPVLARRLRGPGWAIIESNSILDFVDPLLYLAVLDASKSDFKSSARRALARADALVAIGADRGGAAIARPRWDGIEPEVLAAKPAFSVEEPGYWSAALAAFVRDRLESADDAAPAREPAAVRERPRSGDARRR